MASLKERLEALAAAVGQDVKALAILLNGNEVDLSDLTTTSKQNLVAAINELHAQLGSLSGGLSPKWPTAIFGNGVDANSIVAGHVAYVRLPYGGTITKWQLLANDACSCVADVWKATGELPVVEDSITASAKPTLVNSVTASSVVLTGWNTALAEGDVLGFRLNSFSGNAKQVSVTLRIE